MSFQDLKVGDKVDRMIGDGTLLMEMTVMAIKDGIIYCAHTGHTEHWPIEELWQFHAEFGCEEDADLGWGKEFGLTGSYLKKKES